ncbi:DNA-processing protein DprA [Paenibacillus oenotherae]|uniref:DNA-processing protein DprA n=2 Tax=Paenibacillus oenotherae TaxID=1435645 RepID=A0ABS7D0E3_9BACL|nr:DNA-processing protein DprA [Paenibacillus oenotherae]MBW7473311.1 DNA-processing protein DprA [Paenibacillus oenotherae]
MRKEMIITLHELPGIGWQTIRKVVEYGAWDCYQRFTANAWMSSVGMRSEQAGAVVKAFGDLKIGRRCEQLYKRGIHVITRFDGGYPELLSEIPQPPWVLYTIGNLELLNRPSIAIVGTRGPTAYGRKAALDIALGLSEQGITVVSGLARGIDGIAHEGALRASGGTIAVLGSPVDVIYPAENRSLYNEIAGRGLLVSETPLGTSIHPGLFPLRNRIIAGLSLGTVVVEAAEKSGSLITADMALEMSREVFAVPGTISSPKSIGTNRLINRSGAKLITSIVDIMEEYSWLISGGLTGGERGSKGSEPLTSQEEHIFQLLVDQPRSTDELIELSSMPFGLLHAVLINLTIKRKIEQHSGSIYSVL